MVYADTYPTLCQIEESLPPNHLIITGDETLLQKYTSGVQFSKT